MTARIRKSVANEELVEGAEEALCEVEAGERVGLGEETVT